MSNFLSAALPRWSRDVDLSVDADWSFLPRLSVALLDCSPIDVAAEPERSMADVEVFFSGAEGTLSKGAMSLLPFLPISLFNLILFCVSGFI